MMDENRNATQSEKGFTLLEMIVAITLVAMMAVGIWSVFRTSLRAWSRGTEYIDASQRQRNVLDLVRKQIASAYPLMAPVESVSAVIPSPIFNGTETSLRFVSLNSLRFHESPGLTLVNYEVTQDSQGAYILQETEERYLGWIPDSESEIDPPGATALFENMSQCYFEYRSNDENEDPWVPEWEAEERGQLPEAIALTMTAPDMNGITRNHQIIVPVHATSGNLQMNILNRGGIRNLIRSRRMQSGGNLELNIESGVEYPSRGRAGRPAARKPARNQQGGRPPEGFELFERMERGPGRELDREYQDILRRRLEQERQR